MCAREVEEAGKVSREREMKLTKGRRGKKESTEERERRRKHRGDRTPTQKQATGCCERTSSQPDLSAIGASSPRGRWVGGWVVGRFVTVIGKLAQGINHNHRRGMKYRTAGFEKRSKVALSSFSFSAVYMRKG